MSSMISRILSNGIRARFEDQKKASQDLQARFERLVSFDRSEMKNAQMMKVKLTEIKGNRNQNLQTHNEQRQEILEHHQIIQITNDRFDRMGMLLAQLSKGKMEQAETAMVSPMTPASSLRVVEEGILPIPIIPTLIRSNPNPSQQTHSNMRKKFETHFLNQSHNLPPIQAHSHYIRTNRLEYFQSAFDCAIRTQGYDCHYEGHRDAILVCNGFKESENISLALLRRKLELNTVNVIEQEVVLDLVINVSLKMNVRPVIGLQAELRNKHSGHSGSTTGEKGKFGLRTIQIVGADRKLSLVTVAVQPYSELDDRLNGIKSDEPVTDPTTPLETSFNLFQETSSFSEVAVEKPLEDSGECGYGEMIEAQIENSPWFLYFGYKDQSLIGSITYAGSGDFSYDDDVRCISVVSPMGYDSLWDDSNLRDLKYEDSRAETESRIHDVVKAMFNEENPDTLITTNPSFFSQFTLVIATQLVEDSRLKLDRICRDANAMLVFFRSYGLAGFVRVSVKEHTIIDSKSDHFLDDLRLNNPWPELKSFVETIDLNVEAPVAHKHIPYVIILVKMVNEWAKSHSGNLPSTREEKKEFKDMVKSMMIAVDEDNYKEAIEASFKVFAPRGISSEVQQICNDSCAEVSSNSSDFWVMVAALKEFVSNEGDGKVTLEDLEIAMMRRRLPKRYVKDFMRRARSHLFSKLLDWKLFLSLMEQKKSTILCAYISLCLTKSGTFQKSEILASPNNAEFPANEDDAIVMMRFLKAITKESISYGHFRNFMVLLPYERLHDDPRNIWFEAASVTNAILDGSEGIFLGAETIRGLYPVETISNVRRICAETEKVFNQELYFKKIVNNEHTSGNYDANFGLTSLSRCCDDGGSNTHDVDHVDWDVSSRKVTLQLVDMECSYFTAELFRELPQDVEKGDNHIHSIFERYPNAHLEDKVSSNRDGIDKVAIPLALVNKMERGINTAQPIEDIQHCTKYRRNKGKQNKGQQRKEVWFSQMISTIKHCRFNNCIICI